MLYVIPNFTSFNLKSHYSLRLLLTVVDIGLLCASSDHSGHWHARFLPEEFQ
jgi:hypothetical protein